MGFWSSIWSGAVEVANVAWKFTKSVYEGVKSEILFELSPITNLWNWFVTKSKRLVNSFTEWKNNAWNLLKKRYSNWLSGILFTVGVLFFTIPTVLTFLFDTFFVETDNGASGK
jgi:phage-related protein